MKSYSTSIMVNDISRKQTVLIVAALTVVGCILRFYRLDFQSLWYDELHSIIPTNPDATISSIITYCKLDQPPAFFLYLHFFFKFFGYSEYAGRAAAALIGVISIPAIYFLGKECKNNLVGIVAAMFVSVNYFSIFYSQELRFYSFAFLFTILPFLFFIRAFKYDKVVDYLCYIVSSSILLYTHYFGIVIFASQFLIFIALFVFTKVSRAFVLKALAAGIVTALSFIPWLPVVFGDLGIGSFWIQRPKVLFLAEYFYGYFGKDLVAALIFVFLLFTFFRNFKRESQNEQAKGLMIILVFWLVLSYAIPLIRSLTSAPILHIRYTIVTLPAWFILAAWGFSLIKNERGKLVLASLFIVASIVNVFFIRKHYSKITKQQFSEAATVVKQKNTEGLPVMTTFPWHYSYYFNNSQIVPEAVGNLPETVQAFWLMPVQTFSRQEIEDEIGKFPDFEIKQRYSFNATEAILMVRKQ